MFWVLTFEGMQFIRKQNKGFPFLLCAIEIYSKYAWVAPLKSKKGITIKIII